MIHAGCLFCRSECYPNGTMTAMAVKFESAPQLNPSQLTLNDPTCGPVSSDDRFAYFVFSVNSCGTTRKVESLVLFSHAFFRWSTDKSDVSFLLSFCPMCCCMKTRSLYQSI